MADKARTVPLSDLYDFSSGLSKPRSEFGYGHAFLAFKDVLDNYFVPEELSALVNSTDEEQIRCSIRRGDVFLTRTSETQPDLGMSCVALKDYPKATFNGFTKRLRPKIASAVIPEYAAYFFRSPKFRQAVTSMSSLSTRASLNNEMLSRLSIDLPAINIQRTIGFILKSLDDKIELNRRMNGLLEGMARAIFKAWFVDFEPVKAKAAGATSFPGMPQPVFDQLPDALVDSELGEIPEGWEVGTVESACEFNYGKALKATDRREGSVPVYGSNGIVGYHDEALVKGPGIIVGRKGNPGTVIWSNSDFFPIDTTFYISLKQDEVSLPYLRYALQLKNLARFGSDSAVPGLNRNMAYGLPLLVASTCLISEFDALFQSLHSSISVAERESHILAQLRDTLLPKLISGEISVPAAKGGSHG